MGVLYEVDLKVTLMHSGRYHVSLKAENGPDSALFQSLRNVQRNRDTV